MTKFYPLYIIVLLFLSNILYSEGCSDAGLCSLNRNIPYQSTSNFNLSIDLSAESGGDLAKYNYISFTPSYKIDKFTLFAKFPLIYLKGLTDDPNGNNIASYNFSDLTFGGSYSFFSSQEDNLSFTIAGKFPINRSLDKGNGNILPMNLQTNQGSYDLLASFDYLYKSTKIFVGVQLPLTANQNSTTIGNTLLWELERSPDIAFGLKQRININEKSTFNLGILSIYRVIDNSWKLNGASLDSISQKNYKLVDGNAFAINSKGFTLNLLVGFEQKLNENNTIAFNLGLPLLNRKYIDDGLKRAYTINLTTNLGF